MKKLLVVTVLLFTVFIVSIPQTSAQTIYACYNKHSGAMRYVTGSGMCKKTETQVSWNTAGPTGPKGDTGATGPTGPQGVPGVSFDLSKLYVSTTPSTSSPGVQCENDDVAISCTGECASGFTVVFLNYPFGYNNALSVDYLYSAHEPGQCMVLCAATTSHGDYEAAQGQRAICLPRQ